MNANIKFTSLDKLVKNITESKNKLSHIRESVPYIQQKINSKYPKITVEVGNGTNPISVLPKQNNQLKKIIEADNVPMIRLPKVKQVTLNNTIKKERKTPINTIAYNIGENTVEYLFKYNT